MKTENFILSIAHLAKSRLSDGEQAKLEDIKIAYGSGPSGTRGVTFFERWKGKNAQAAPFVEICAFGQESHLQVAGTTIHELAHALAGFEAGHGPEWKAACARLGLRRVKAAGTRYCLAMFEPDLRHAIARLDKPQDGEPIPPAFSGSVKPKPCHTVIGVRGGKSRGKGSGSRLRLFVCDCEPPVKARVARDTFLAQCLCCNANFRRG